MLFNPLTAEDGEGVVLQIDQKANKNKNSENLFYLFQAQWCIKQEFDELFLMKFDKK